MEERMKGKKAYGDEMRVDTSIEVWIPPR